MFNIMKGCFHSDAAFFYSFSTDCCSFVLFCGVKFKIIDNLIVALTI